LHGKPQSLKDFLENGENDLNRAIWVPGSDAFVCIQQWQVEDRPPRAYREGVFEVTLSSDKHRFGGLSVFSPTVEQAIPCLEFLFGIHDSHFLGLRSGIVVLGKHWRLGQIREPFYYAF
jgi:hypothetical protein